jgi:hypothetical protein
LHWFLEMLDCPPFYIFTDTYSERNVVNLDVVAIFIIQTRFYCSY